MLPNQNLKSSFRALRVIYVAIDCVGVSLSTVDYEAAQIIDIRVMLVLFCKYGGGPLQAQ